MAHGRKQGEAGQVEYGGQEGAPGPTVGSTQGKVSEVSAPPKKLLECGWEKRAVKRATHRGPDTWRLRQQGWAWDNQTSDPSGLPQTQGHRAPRILGLRAYGTTIQGTGSPGLL